MKKRRILTGLIAIVLLLSNIPVFNVKSYGESGVQDFANVVLFAYFADEENPDYFNKPSVKDSSKTSGEYIQWLYDGDYGRSFTNYMDTISGGKFKVHNIFPQLEDGKINAYKLPFTKSEAQTSNIDYSMIKNIVTNVSTASDLVVDYDNDGCVDNLTIILIGEASYSYEGEIPTLYPHQSSYPGDESLSGKLIRKYNVLNTGRMVDTLLADESGVICHEFLHSLGYPDLYVSDSSSYPVYNWDIMGLSSKYVNYPLAYLRMYFSGWVELETVTASRQLSLELPGGDGDQAYILQSPINPYEVFVVERRQQTDKLDENSIDSDIGKSGIIVYRVDTTVSGLSNFHGKTAVYVFRPQPGMVGHDDNERLALKNAALSLESGRTSIGSSDMDAGLEDGALTFSDGSNSGIVIENVSSVNDEHMTIDVTIPDASEFDMWNDTQLPDAQNSTVTSFEGAIYSAAVNGNQVQLYKYNAGRWEVCGTPVNDPEGISDIQLQASDNALVMAYTDGYGELSMMSYDSIGEKWIACGTVPNVNSFDMEADSGHTYISYVVNNSTVYLAEVDSDGSSYSILGEAFKSSLCGSPRVLICNNEVYVSARDAIASNKIVVRKYEGANTFSEIASPDSASAYTIIGYNDTMYYASGSTSGIQVKKYNGQDWEDYASKSDINSFEPELAVAQGNLYILTSPATENSSERTRVFEISEGTFKEEGTAVDLKSRKYSLAASGDSLFVSYINNSGKAVIKQKTTANRLLSLTITAPNKVVYLKGENVSTEGLKVTANYINGSRELNTGEYTISNFSTEQTGEKLAVVSFGGISNSFAYTVYEESEPTEQIISSVKLNGIVQPTAGEAVYKNISCSTNGVSIASLVWNTNLANFDYDTVYTFDLTLNTQSGYVFDASVSIDSGDFKPSVSRISDSEIRLTYVFDATEKDIVDEKKEGSLKIVMKSSDGKSEGFSFRVTGADGYNQVFVTDKNGQIVIDNLSIGEYTVSEISDSVSADYILPADKTVTVTEGIVTTVEMYNELRETPTDPETPTTPEEPTTPETPTIPENPTNSETSGTSESKEISGTQENAETSETPDTGDTGNPVIWIIMAGIAGAGAFTFVVFAVNGKEKENVE